uniref:Uncharacterized protein n=1 Tax=Marseillevirus LCMAC202 TaxID=2506606 RepID=A0A481YXG3_9VIRU|nr:MAG: hypothetical protein LCMAC202_02830 [Marseillevirus LCMAC202]
MAGVSGGRGGRRAIGIADVSGGRGGRRAIGIGDEGTNDVAITVRVTTIVVIVMTSSTNTSITIINKVFSILLSNIYKR